MNLLSSNEVTKCRDFFKASKKTKQGKKEKDIFDSFDYIVYKFTNLLGDLSKKSRHDQLQKEKYVLCLFNSAVYDEPKKMKKLLALQQLFEGSNINSYDWLKDVKSQLDKFLFYVELIRIQKNMKLVIDHTQNNIEFKSFLQSIYDKIQQHLTFKDILIMFTQKDAEKLLAHIKSENTCKLYGTQVGPSYEYFLGTVIGGIHPDKFKKFEKDIPFLTTFGKSTKFNPQNYVNQLECKELANTEEYKKYHSKHELVEELTLFNKLYEHKDNLYKYLFAEHLELFNNLLDEHKKSKYLKYKTKYLKLKKELNII